ncbi:10032_t:CDS:2 [Entrophospora sp. SA101]|nr:12495_t:CDS:2 [Entrophospora sp. SA101]CAJ0916218.1 10032_t:CDS:2 [Entrophospora sp. SA101]
MKNFIKVLDTKSQTIRYILGNWGYEYVCSRKTAIYNHDELFTYWKHARQQLPSQFFQRFTVGFYLNGLGIKETSENKSSHCKNIFSNVPSSSKDITDFNNRNAKAFNL